MTKCSRCTVSGSCMRKTADFIFTHSPANPLVLAPMAGTTDRPFRTLAKRCGAGLVCMEMISANAIKYGNKKTEELIRIDQGEHPVSLQIFGPDPETMAHAAEYLTARYDFDVLDINMGCPMPKIVNNGEGSALMRDPKLAAEIVRQTVKKIHKPMTVKIRKGFNDDEINAVEMAKRLEDAGAAAITVHGRTREQYYSGSADWEIIRQVKEAVRIPVIGNGDVTGPGSARALMEQTGCDAVMIGRAARGNPWIFRQILENSQTKPSAAELREMVLRHARMVVDQDGEGLGIRKMRKHVAWYTAGYPHSSKLRGMSNNISTMDDLRNLLTLLEA